LICYVVSAIIKSKKVLERGGDIIMGMSFEHEKRFTGQGIWKKYPFFWFILFLTYRCTRRCEYCYTFRQVNDEDMEMDEKTFSRLLEWIPEVWRLNGVKENAILFLGGEPLLRTERIKRVMDRIERDTDGMQTSIFTNADLVDRVNWDDLKDIQWMYVHITDISIDELKRRIKVIKDNSNVKGQTIVATLDDYNLERILDITRFGIEAGYRLRYQMDIYRGMDRDFRTRLLKRYHELCDLLEGYVVKGYPVHTIFLLDTLIPLWEDETSPYPCGKRLAVVYPDGGIGPCIRHHSLKTGTIFDHDPLNRIQYEEFHYDIHRTDIPDECRTCVSRTVCQGGCPHSKVVLTGTTSGKSVLCEVHREIIPRLRYLNRITSS
jgi:uncharacterized protein